MDSTIAFILAAGLVTGFSKFSVGGMGLIILPLIMFAYPGPQALGIILPMYIITDIMAITSYRKNICWPVIVRTLPLSVGGVILGGWMLSTIDISEFTLLLGAMIISMLLLGIWLDKSKALFMQNPATGHAIGLFAGFVSMTSNAAGPLFSLYLMEQNLSKESYVSTRAWLFLMINFSKVPILWSLGLLNTETITLSIQGVPGLIIGAVMGYWLLGRLKLLQFKWLIRGMATIAAIKLFVFG